MAKGFLELLKEPLGGRGERGRKSVRDDTSSLWRSFRFYTLVSVGHWGTKVAVLRTPFFEGYQSGRRLVAIYCLRLCASLCKCVCVRCNLVLCPPPHNFQPFRMKLTMGRQSE